MQAQAQPAVATAAEPIEALPARELAEGPQCVAALITSCHLEPRLWVMKRSIRSRLASSLALGAVLGFNACIKLEFESQKEGSKFLTFGETESSVP